MGVNSPIPVRLPEECRKAAKILRSFVDSNNNGLDKVVPRSVLERAAGFAIFTVVKAGFVFSARAGSGVVIARLQDGSWSAPSAIGLGGFGFGGQVGAEVTDFMIVLNSRSAVASFMSAGSLTLGGNLSVAVGPLGRNAEGSGAINNKGKIAAMYSYSKTKGLFGGVSVEGSLIVERQDANRLAYGGNPTSKQILSGVIDPPDWADVLIDQLEKCTGLPGGQKWRDYDEEGEGGGMGLPSTRDRSGSTGYAFGEGIGSGGRGSPNLSGGITGGSSSSKPEGRKRSGSLFSPSIVAEKSGQTPARPSSGGRRSSSFNPFSSGSSSPRRAVLSSSESYNAGLTWDSSGPLQGYGGRSRSGSSALRPIPTNEQKSTFNSEFDEDKGLAAGDFPEPEDDLLGDWGSKSQQNRQNGTTRKTERLLDPEEPDLLGRWDANGTNLSASFAKLSTSGNGRARSNSRPTPTPFDDLVDLGDDHLPKEWKSPNKIGRTGLSNGGSPYPGEIKEQPYSSYAVPSPKAATPVKSPFDDPGAKRSISGSRPFDEYFPTSQHSMPLASSRTNHDTPPPISLKPGLENIQDGYARAVALFDFKPTDPGDLGLTKGQIVRCLDSVGKGDWWKGRGNDGREGIFPSSYVEVLEIPKELRGGLTRSQLKARVGGIDDFD